MRTLRFVEFDHGQLDSWPASTQGRDRIPPRRLHSDTFPALNKVDLSLPVRQLRHPVIRKRTSE